MQKEKVVKACKSTIGTILIAIFIVIGVFLAIKISKLNKKIKKSIA